MLALLKGAWSCYICIWCSCYSSAALSAGAWPMWSCYICIWCLCYFSAARYAGVWSYYIMYICVCVVSVLPPVLVPRQSEIPDKFPVIEDFSDTVPANTDFPVGLAEQTFNLPGKNIFLVFFVAQVLFMLSSTQNHLMTSFSFSFSSSSVFFFFLNPSLTKGATVAQCMHQMK